jgi:DNA mismatch endonuclease, patch repair protein
VDTLTPSERSARMKLVKSKNTRPELIVQNLVRSLGYRFRPHDVGLPGRPDFVFPNLRKVVFVHGCFWHRHNRCELARLPKTRLDFWVPKLAANKLRDTNHRRALTRLGWESLVIWECELRDPVKLMIKTLIFLEG